MPAPALPSLALIAADNRLLGWSLTDLTLYGTQPVPGMVVGRAGDAVVPPTPSSAVAPPSDPGALAPNFHDSVGSETALFDDGSGHDGGAPLAPAAPVSLPHTTVSPAAEFVPAVPQPIGAGSFVQPAVATALPVVEQPEIQQHGAGPVDASAVGQAVPTAMPALDSAQSLAAIAPVLDAAHDALTAPVLDAAHGVLSTPALAPIAGTTASLADLVGHELQAVAPATDLLDHTLDATAPLTAPVAGLVGTTLDAVSHALDPVDHGPADSFGGADPAAGIATLVGMVDSADAFDIGHVTAATTQPVGSILESLTHDALPSPLLGDAHADADAGHHDTSHVVDDHGIHLGL